MKSKLTEVMQEIIFSDIGLIEYEEAWNYQKKLFNEIIEHKMETKGKDTSSKKLPDNRLLFCEHPHVYTLGKSGAENNLLINSQELKKKKATFFKIDRGGDITYHGPGQIVGYPIFDLARFSIGLKDYIFKLEEAIIITLKKYNITSERFKGATGVWLESSNPARARKICAIGIKSSRWVTMHGFAFNVNTDLSFYRYINPCGFIDKGVTSLAKEVGHDVDMQEVKDLLRDNIFKLFR